MSLLHVMRTVRTTLVLSLAALYGAGCSIAAPRVSRDVVLEETRLVASRSAGGEIAVVAYTAEELFREGNALLREGNCASAVERFDRVADEFAASRFVSPALYNAGLCLQEAGELAGAVLRYGRLVSLLPGSSDARHARLQMAAALVGLERWAETLEVADALLGRDDLDEGERLESLARRAQALLGLGRVDEAEAAARSTTAYFRVHRDALPDEHFAAAGQFVLAETLRARAEDIEIPAADALTQHAALERRAALILDAQRAYYDAIRLTDAYWASASGYRVGAMYESLFQALSHAPVPPPAHDLGEAALVAYRERFREELAARIRPLVRHAIHYWDLTLMMVERTGASGEWVERTRAELDRARSVLLGARAEREGAADLADPREPGGGESGGGERANPSDAESTAATDATTEATAVAETAAGHDDGSARTASAPASER